MTKEQLDAAKERDRKRIYANLIDTLVEQGAEKHYAALYIDARAHIGFAIAADGTYNGAFVTIAEPSGQIRAVASDNRHALRAFAREMRRADPTAALGAAAHRAETRQERVAMLRENLIDTLVLRGATLSKARSIADDITIGVTTSNGPAIAVLGEARFEDEPMSLAVLAGSLQAKHPDAFTNLPSESASTMVRRDAQRDIVATAI